MCFLATLLLIKNETVSRRLNKNITIQTAAKGHAKSKSKKQKAKAKSKPFTIPMKSRSQIRFTANITVTTLRPRAKFTKFNL